MNTGIIPGFGIKGPVLTPREYDVHQVIKWLAIGIDVREVMEDGSYRKLKFSDEKLMNEACKDIEKQRIERNRIEEEVKAMDNKPEIKPSKKQVQFVPVVEEQNKRNKKQEPKKHVEEVKEEVAEEKKPSFEVDELEPME
jgi:hypothetical protein